MNTKLLALILSSVTLSAFAQLLLKLGMSSAPIQQLLARDRSFQLVGAVLTSLPVMSGLALYGLGAVIWLLVLARTDVSFAYPFVGLGFVLTMLLGWLILQEPVGWIRLAGTTLVALGVYLVSRS